MSILDRAVVGLLPLIPRPLVVRFSRPYIAGRTLAEAFETVRALNSGGMSATVDLLGENVTNLTQAGASGDSYLHILEEISKGGADTNVSLKLTQMGLKLDLEACAANVRRLVEKARDLGLFVRIDMEDSSCTSETLAIYTALRAEFENVGVVLQAMLRRTLADARALARIPANIRLCKGIYLEPNRQAYQNRELINRNFTLVLETLLQAGCYVGIATHDEVLVWEAMRLIHQIGLRRDQVEFQMLLGVQEELRRIILDEGYRLRVYVPFGDQAYDYALRRMRENPRLAGVVARNLLRGRAS